MNQKWLEKIQHRNKAKALLAKRAQLVRKWNAGLISRERARVKLAVINWELKLLFGEYVCLRV